MTAYTIYQTLRDFPISDDVADRAARDGFLEWLITLPALDNPFAEARRAVKSIEIEADDNRACTLFLNFLEQAADSAGQTPRRKGGAKMRRRILH